MLDKAAVFNSSVVEKLQDKDRFQRLNNLYVSSQKAFKKGALQFSNIELARQRAAYTKWKTIESLDKYLIEFEAQFNKRGGKVIWTQNAEECVKEICDIINKAGAKSVLKSKSSTLEEIKLKDVLRLQNIAIVETDLGDFIQDADNESAFHFVLPAVHKSKEQVAESLKKVIPDVTENNTAEELTRKVRNHLREKFFNADIGITGANFLIAETGAVSISENEGNTLLATAFPKIHIVVAGIEKVLPSMNDLDVFWPLLASHGTGQDLTAYNSLYFGPRQAGEIDGPQEMYVILLDNNRSALIEEPDMREASSCIHCGACLNVCPVYKHAGGHAYGSVYSGPIGSVVTPYLEDFEENIHLSYASTSCGKCTEVCPVKIDLHKLLLYNRQKAIEKKNLAGKKEKWVFYIWRKAMLKRSSMNQGGTKAKKILLESFFKKGWGSQREFPKLAPKSFNELWKDQNPHIYNS